MKNIALAALALGICVLTLAVVVGCEKKSDDPAAVPATAPAVSAFANTRCPIMASNKIDPAKVPDNLIREHKGQKVAFCCGGCPPAWDKLSDEAKDAALLTVK